MTTGMTMIAVVQRPRDHRLAGTSLILISLKGNSLMREAMITLSSVLLTQ